MAGRDFSVVTGMENNGEKFTTVVPTKWIEGDIVWWPKSNAPNKTKLLMTCATPNSRDFTDFNLYGQPRLHSKHINYLTLSLPPPTVFLQKYL